MLWVVVDDYGLTNPKLLRRGIRPAGTHPTLIRLACDLILIPHSIVKLWEQLNNGRLLGNSFFRQTMKSGQIQAPNQTAYSNSQPQPNNGVFHAVELLQQVSQADGSFSWKIPPVERRQPPEPSHNKNRAKSNHARRFPRKVQAVYCGFHCPVAVGRRDSPVNENSHRPRVGDNESIGPAFHTGKCVFHRDIF